ncbi:dicarboxylate/amino acid:cation symporter [[Clostridium] symbiosum]|uniref:dicarboxylate/amino acid:cation symporter n=1 Tax=Clostridium symbiosum TaxID=1512 RepID=UPI001D088E16|nr:dicarboxylate/amino acid:cation symporter [[Clostridium] symbiosum]MCB6607222.1 dicarboxylate/amino acid:cation symporter [[Clostridium] symbiosum]MCB6929782.1 dicarboxylate/amino acid:cation symporter [[Clostridium] symbiosum]
MKETKKMPMFAKIAIGFVLGILSGVLLRERAAVFEPIGDLFMRMLKMLILPLVFSAIISGLTSIPDMKKIYKMGIKAFILFVVMTALAILTGIVFANLFRPGVGAAIQMPVADTGNATDVSFIATILNMFPTNVFASFSGDNMLQVIVFAFFFGICIVMCGEKAEPVKVFFDRTAQVMYKMTDIVISFAPFGVFGLMSGMIGKYGLSTLLPLGKFIIVLHLALIVFIFVIQAGLVVIGVRMNPIKFYKGIFGAISMALATDSSAAALPVAIKELQNNLGVSEAIASFIMSVGTNVSKSGSALYQGMTVIFIAQVAGVQLSMAQQVTVFVTALLASLGTAGVPSASIVMLTMTLGSVNLPLEGVALMTGIDRIIGGQRTLPNVITNAAISAMLDRQEKIEQGQQPV